ncbi:hypothetical protein LO763_19560 [Glycomyces sp. A-F 0318]|uniref:hypothetical protein n=1 Tax=Glycomyces amatae TaxID=2881355 RepID=UPI001E4A720F|nr:hypothetical protein [Glycomyces amatae]MCD0445809.1 hypothetical protein [Glycomyces amatae]
MSDAATPSATKTAVAGKLTGDEYMKLLEQRRDAWEAAHPAREAVQAQIERIKRDFPGVNPVIRSDWKPPVALLEWFIEPGDENLVELPEPKPKRQPQPRVYRSAASLREERDRLASRRAAIIGMDDDGDMAIVNLSPFARSKAARAAGRRRFAKLDRDLARVASLNRRIDALDFRIAAAETREARAAAKEQM